MVGVVENSCFLFFGWFISSTVSSGALKTYGAKRSAVTTSAGKSGEEVVKNPSIPVYRFGNSVFLSVSHKIHTGSVSLTGAGVSFLSAPEIVPAQLTSRGIQSKRSLHNLRRRSERSHILLTFVAGWWNRRLVSLALYTCHFCTCSILRQPHIIDLRIELVALIAPEQIESSISLP